MSTQLALLLAIVIVLGATGGMTLLRRRRHARRLYRRALENAIADGTLTAEETADLERLRQEKDLTPAEVRMVARAIYRHAIREAVADARLTPEEDQNLTKLQLQLGLTEAELGDDHGDQLARLRLLGRVEAGKLPTVDSPVALVPHEVAHWVVQASLADRLEIPRRGRTAPAGIDLVVGGNAAFSAASHREELRPREEILPVDLGMFVVTSRRAIFQGARRTVSVPHARLEHIHLFQDGLRLEELGTESRGYILLEDAELTSAILLQAARRRREEIRPTRRGRTA